MPGIAANQVFAIPELLEHILHDLANKPTPEVHTRRPETSLFPLLRVNKTFKATIDGSAKLKRMMFLAPVNPIISNVHQAIKNSQNCAPLEWLFGELAVSYEHMEFDRDNNRYIYVLTLITTNEETLNMDSYEVDYLSDTLHEFGERALAEPNATWRHMMIGWTKDDAATTIVLPVKVNNHDQHQYDNVSWTFGPNERLGAVFARWESFLATLGAATKEFERLNAIRASEDAVTMGKALCELREG